MESAKKKLLSQQEPTPDSALPALASGVFAAGSGKGRAASSLASVARTAERQDNEWAGATPTPTRLSAVLRSLWPRCRSTATAGAAAVALGASAGSAFQAPPGLTIKPNVRRVWPSWPE